jgi:hypothetical protein
MNTMNYTAGYNLPGCLPEMEPQRFDTFDEAKRFVIRELKQGEDTAENEDEAERFCHTAEDVNLESGPFAIGPMPDGYVYWVEESER